MANQARFETNMFRRLELMYLATDKIYCSNPSKIYPSDQSHMLSVLLNHFHGTILYQVQNRCMHFFLITSILYLFIDFVLLAHIFLLSICVF